MDSTVLPFSLSEELRRRLEALAKRDEQLASRFVDLVLREALECEAGVKTSVDRGPADVESGHTMSTEELEQRVNARIASSPDMR